jgi:hypothetical protein
MYKGCLLVDLTRKEEDKQEGIITKKEASNIIGRKHDPR